MSQNWSAGWSAGGPAGAPPPENGAMAGGFTASGMHARHAAASPSMGTAPPGYGHGQGQGQHGLNPGWQQPGTAQAFGAGASSFQAPQAAPQVPMMPLMNDATKQVATAIGLSYGEKMMQWGRTRMGWFTGEGFYYLFNVDGPYVLKKIVRLAFPWTVSEWVRKADQGSGRYQPPKVDVNAPDLYIPVCATGLLVTLHALQEALLGTFTPLSVHSDVTWFVLTWLFQYGLFYTLIKLGAPEEHGYGAGSLQASVAQRGVQVRHAELVAYAGYLFVFAVVPSTVAVFGSRLVWTIALFYAWLALSRFMLKALEAIKMSAHQQNSQAQNYAFFMGILLELFVLWFVSIKTIAPSSPAPASTPAPAPA